ncbi:hypothetical protein UPYG_G00249270 [Umbra pygmaea]|uniref:Uncharacterized protein n=1 Tax=Umbra pygmaea TaxID=75934 RepID=A0ABD0WX44_UMBPY
MAPACASDVAKLVRALVDSTEAILVNAHPDRYVTKAPWLGIYSTGSAGKRGKEEINYSEIPYSIKNVAGFWKIVASAQEKLDVKPQAKDLVHHPLKNRASSYMSTLFLSIL